MAERTTTTRPLAGKDLERIIAIDQRITGRSRRGFFAKRFAALAEDAPAFVALAAERDGGVAGFAIAHISNGEFGGTTPVGVVDALGVDPEVARAGVGQTMLAALETELASRGVRELRTEADWSEHHLTAFFSATGFRLAPRLVLERAVTDPLPAAHAGSGDEEFTWEQLPVRSMRDDDLPAIVHLDRKITGRDRSEYYQRKAAEVLKQSGVRVSLVAEVDRQFAGFLMARVDFGEFGRAEPSAVLDTIGVDPAYAKQNVGRALLLQLLLNLGSLRVERLFSQAEWTQLGLVQFLARTGFGLSQRLPFVKSIG